MKGDPNESKEALITHLTELRRRIIIVVLFFLFFFAVTWNFSEATFDILTWPLRTGALRSGVGLQAAQMNHLDLTEPFFVLLKTAMFSAMFLTAPVLFYQGYRFVAPGLYQHEKRAILPFMLLTTIFFLSGCAFCFFFVMPYGYEFLLKFSQNISNPELQMRQYLDLTTKFILAFGFLFELPVVAMFLSLIGVVTHRHLIKYARYAIVLAFIISALLTPPDVFTQAMMAIPLCSLYAISIAVAWFFTRRRERRQLLDPSTESANIND